MPASTQLSVGSVVAGFRIDSQIGRGGMGVVYKATQLSLERPVALKLISPELAHEKRFRERFLREARLAASLDHPHLLPVYEAGSAEGTLFLAMRLVEGDSLAELLRREGRLSPERSLRLFGQLAQALQTAHEAGLLHRDVKPGNVLLAEEGEREHAYLCDFGLSRRLAGGSSTDERAFVGTVAYAAPEQIRGEALDERCDLYSLGCLLYKCLTGAPPFQAEDELALSWAHLHEPPPAPSGVDPALARFDRFFARALGKDPGERFASASELAAAALAAADARAPLAPSTPPPAPNLPRPLTSFLGRERELQDVLTLLEEDVRLLTLTGPGGTGKTRLALRAAEEAAPLFANGIHWVGLATLRDPSLVTETIAQTLDAKGGLAEHIGERELLLLLDNLEQVVEAAPDLSSLLQNCPKLTLLITSRELLRVQGEVEYPVPPLAEGEAVSLFCERAQIEPTVEISELCRRVDNLPLAVELAAARTKALTPKQILERLSSRLDLLKGGRDADHRQQTLRATIAWSYNLLSEEEPRLFRSLSVFAGGCTLEAAEEIAGADVDALQSLVEKSLLRFSNERYWMLETIREYAAERLLESGEAETLKRRHADFVLELAGRLQATQWLDPEVREQFRREDDNFRAALSWAADTGRVQLQLELLARIWRFWWYRGSLSEGIRWVEAALDGSHGERSERRAKVLVAGAAFGAWRGELDRVKRYAEESLEVARAVGDTETVGWALITLGLWATETGDHDGATRLFNEAMALARETADSVQVGVAINNLGDLALRRGDYAAALPFFEEALATWEELGVASTDDIAVGKYNVAVSLHRTGRSEEAVSVAKEALELARELGSLISIGDALVLVASLAVWTGGPQLGARLLGAAQVVREGVGAEPVGDEAVLVAATAADLRASLGDEQYASTVAEGRAMSLDDAVAQALRFTD